VHRSKKIIEEKEEERELAQEVITGSPKRIVLGICLEKSC
jgi:hypothetical protein